MNKVQLLDIDSNNGKIKNTSIFNKSIYKILVFVILR